MRRLQYFLGEASASLVRGGLSSLIAIGTIALALLVLGAFMLVTSTLDRLTSGWASAAELSVYLQDEATSDDRAAIEAALAASRVVERREFVSKTQAAARFRHDFPDLASAASGAGADLFPASIDVRLRPGVLASTDISRLAQSLARMPGVADVRYDRQWLDRLARLVAVVRWTGIALAAALAMAAALTIAAVVRLTLEGRRDEVEIMGLVGAPISAIRAPFVLEGVLQGGAGAILALAGLGVVYAVVRARLASDAAALSVVPMQFLSVPLSLALVAGGMIVGCMGGLVATRSVR